MFRYSFYIIVMSDSAYMCQGKARNWCRVFFIVRLLGTVIIDKEPSWLCCLGSLNETFMCNSITMCHFHRSTVVVTRRTNNESDVQFYFDDTLWCVAIVDKITTCQHPGNCARVCYYRRLPGSRRTLCTGDERLMCAINLSLIPYANLCGFPLVWK